MAVIVGESQFAARGNARSGKLVAEILDFGTKQRFGQIGPPKVGQRFREQTDDGFAPSAVETWIGPGNGAPQTVACSLGFGSAPNKPATGWRAGPG